MLPRFRRDSVSADRSSACPGRLVDADEPAGNDRYRRGAQGRQRSSASNYCWMLMLRQAVPEDDRALAEISFECWAESNDPGDLWARDRPFFGPHTDARVEDVIVAPNDGWPVGYVRTLHRPSEYGDWYVAGVGVSPASRSMGMGRSLVQAALEKAGIGGGARVWLKVLSTNEPGLRLYRSLGFAESARSSGAFANRPGVDDLRLSIMLPPAAAP